MFYTYVLRSKNDEKFYTGATGDLRERFKLHNKGEVFSTKGRGPFELIYYEACNNSKDAFLREKYLKSGPGKRYLKNRLKRSLSLTGFTPLEVASPRSSGLAPLARARLLTGSTPLNRY